MDYIGTCNKTYADKHSQVLCYYVHCVLLIVYTNGSGLFASCSVE